MPLSRGQVRVQWMLEDGDSGREDCHWTVRYCGRHLRRAAVGREEWISGGKHAGFPDDSMVQQV